MPRLAWLVLPALALGACLFEVEDVVTGGPDAGVGGDAGAKDVGGEGWLGGAGGLDGGGDAAETGSDAESDASEAGDAASEAAGDASDAQPDSGVTWSSCKSLGYAGTCFGTNTVLFFYTSTCGGSDKCFVNDCSLKAGTCKNFGAGCGGGWGCTNILDPAQAEGCASWTTGKCRDNTVIKSDPSDPKNCLYRSCGSKTCVADGGVADCI